MESDPPVSLLGKSLVVPATPTKIRHLFLPCLDIFWQDTHYNRRVIFYKPSGKDLSSAIKTLKTSLSLVLVHFYPWAGRLAFGEDHRLMIDCNDLGVEFVEATIDLSISTLETDDFQMKGFFDKLCQNVEHKNGSLLVSPLLSVQATRFSDGGLAVAVAQSHVVADGQSLWHFMVSWGDCARGEKLSLEPLHDRAMFAVPDPSPEKAVLEMDVDIDKQGTEKSSERETEGKTKDLTASNTMKVSTTENVAASVTENETKRTDFTTGEVKPNGKPTEKLMGTKNRMTTATAESMEESGAMGEEQEALVQHTFYMSGATIKKLKSEAAEATGRIYSSYEILGAHFWQRVAIARRRPAWEVSRFAFPTSYRNRLTPPLPPSYFGNVVSFVVAKSNAGTISGESIGAIARRIHAAIAACTEERLRRLMHWLELHDNRLAPYVKKEGKSVSVASSPRFPVYEVDFGWGKPAAVRAVKVPGDGEMVLFGGRPGSNPGDVEICMPLPSQVLQNLLQDPLFLASSSLTT